MRQEDARQPSQKCFFYSVSLLPNSICLMSPWILYMCWILLLILVAFVKRVGEVYKWNEGRILILIFIDNENIRSKQHRHHKAKLSCKRDWSIFFHFIQIFFFDENLALVRLFCWVTITYIYTNITRIFL